MREKLLATLFLLLTITGLSAAPPVDVPAEVKGQPHSFIVIEAKTAGTVVKFVALDPGLTVFPPNLLAEKKTTVVSSPTPGTYRVLAYSSVKNDPTDPAIIRVVIGDGKKEDPKPNPDPKPDPTPDPVVKVDSVWVLLVEDPAAGRTKELAALMSSKFWGELKPKHEFRFYLSTSEKAVANGYTKEGAKVGFPAVLFVNAADGSLLTAYSVKDKTEADLSNTLKKYVK